jgi:hypothetical protein
MPVILKLCCLLFGGALIADMAIFIIDSLINFDEIPPPVWSWIVGGNTLVVFIDLAFLALLIAFMRRVSGSREWLRVFAGVNAVFIIAFTSFDDSTFQADNLAGWGLMFRDWLEVAVCLVLTILLGSARTKAWFDPTNPSLASNRLPET